ncbi:MAG: nicotinate (nicotinamide) nucleotide adenylyltransferase [Erysipelotrichales bacterium]|nr:nicotinate (nicotinamide) nucleotide adenylyltransferase [Erysipelotrichales bacterium]
MRIGVYCGSFNPVHKGHIRIVRAVLRQKLADRVLIIPTGNYWDKQDLLPVEDRIRMLRHFENEKIRIDDTHNGIPYTVEVFEALEKEYPEDTLCLIVGGDNLPAFDKWVRYRDLLKYDFIIVPRSPVTPSKVIRYMEQFSKENYAVLKTRNIPISSTAIRENLDDYEKIKDMIDYRVYQDYREILKK